MNTAEIVELLELLRKLTLEQQKEFYYMVKGAAFVSESVHG